ncbi:MAG TPA: hypothetical protein VG738_07520 [Chitinophagaceae bacterium]|nr:hypothetical protein [Chitinophagaceae bacterium]
MERTGALIERLLQQYHDNADAGKMLVTIQLLAAELQQQAQATAGAGKKVSVVMPAYINNVVAGQEMPIPSKPPAPIPEKEAPVTIAIPPAVEEVRETAPPQKPELTIPKQPLQFDPIKEIPTLTHQQTTRAELNEIIGTKGESLNERLRANSVELGAVLQSSPVKDLKKAIGINDRYVFINELFRGDEVMYERSIKTINSFSILAEAEFWIKRELKLKLAWNETSEAVKVFDQLVKRRFS